MNVPDDLLYTHEHEWARTEGTRARVGITDFAQDALGDVVFVSLPEVGSTVEAGGTLGEVESTKSVSEIYSPLAGTVLEVNSELTDAPELVNDDPYGDGWLILLEIAEPKEATKLLSPEAYRELTAD